MPSTFFKALAVVVATLAMAPGHATEAPASILLYASVKAGIDAGGHAHVEGVERVGSLKPHTAIRDRLEASLTQRIESWQFEPATRDGQPTASRTNVGVWLEARDEGGALRFMIRMAQTGGGIVAMQPPMYPTDALRAGAEGTVTLVVGYGADGKQTDAHVENVVATKGAGVALSKAASFAARSWKFEPEQVAGTGQPGRVRVPVVFCTTGCSELVKGTLPTGNEAVAIEPSVRLRSAVAGTAL